MSNPVKPSGVRGRLGDSTRPAGGYQGAPAPPAQDSETANPLRRIAFLVGAVLVFIRFSIIHQLLAYVLHVNLYLLYLFGFPAFLGVALAGGIQRTMRGRTALYWTLFAVWLIASVPFSSWRGGSVAALKGYLRTDFPMLFVIAGLALTWRECRLIMGAIASGAVVFMAAARLFQQEGGRYGERLALNFGIVADPNDYACHLLLVLPFVAWVGLTARPKALRLAAWCGVAYGLLLVLKTGSRGALVALAAGVLFWLLQGTMRQRIGLILVGPIAAVALIALTPRDSLTRILSFSAQDAGASQEAIESATMRRYLLKQSILYTLTHPVFGVGLDQFSSFEGQHNQIVGAHGYWHSTHNSYTQVSSECGLPALALYLAGIVSTFLLVNRTHRQARARPDCDDIRTATFCIMLGMTMYCTAIAFLNFAYFFYLPALASLAIAVGRAAQDEFGSRSAGSAAPVQTLQQFWLPRRKATTPA